MDSARLSALLQAAERFAPADLVVDVHGDCKDQVTRSQPLSHTAGKAR
jgi:hypothetical protein